MARKKRTTAANNETSSFHEAPPSNKRIKLNGSQQRALTAIQENAVTIIIGEAGGGKSFVAMYAARDMLLNKEVEKIVVIRSPMDVSRRGIGFLKGGLDEKLEPWALASKCIAKDLRIEDKVEFYHMGFIQGMTFTDCCVILEEAQSLTMPELEAVVTRLGLGSKFIATGDPKQDICRSNGIMPFVDVIRDVDGVAIVEFGPEENQRHPVVRDIRRALYAHSTRS